MDLGSIQTPVVKSKKQRGRCRNNKRLSTSQTRCNCHIIKVTVYVHIPFLQIKKVVSNLIVFRLAHHGKQNLRASSSLVVIVVGVVVVVL